MGKAARPFIWLCIAGMMLSGCSVADVTAPASAGGGISAGDARALAGGAASAGGAGASQGDGSVSAGGASPSSSNIIASAHFESLDNDLRDESDPADAETPLNSDGASNPGGRSDSNAHDTQTSSDPGATPDSGQSPDGGATAPTAGSESTPTPKPGAAGADAGTKSDLLPAAGPGLPPELPASAIPPAPIDYPLDAKANGFSERDRKKGSGQSLIGALIIPAIDFRETIVAGAGKAEIKKNVGRLGGTCNPGEFGQCILTGHRYYDWGNMFNRLDELVVGDKVDVAMPDGMYYRYIVREVILSEPKPYDLFYPNGKFEMTLVTCHPIHVSTHQLLIRCELQTVVEKDGTQHAPVKPE